jgi:hypothetical protein
MMPLLEKWFLAQKLGEKACSCNPKSNTMPGTKFIITTCRLWVLNTGN